MIKSYIATRVFVMVDIVMGVLFLVGLIIGFHVLLAYAAAVTLIWCTIVIPLAWLGVWSVGHRLNLVHRKHTFEQYLYEQRAGKELDSYHPTPPSTTIHQQNNILSNKPVARLGQVRTEDMDTNVLSNVLSDGEEDDVIVAPQMIREELVLYRNERQQPGQKLTDLQLCQVLGWKQNASGQRRVRRLRDKMKQEHKL
jgi:hypothetical protein